MRTLFALSLACLAAVTVAGEDSVFQHHVTAAELPGLIAAGALQAASARTLRGHFEQFEHLPELPHPLRSTGEFLVARDVGMRWHTRTPFDSVFVLTPKGMSTRDEGGALNRVRAEDHPGVAEGARILFELFSLDFQALTGDFDTYGTSTRSAGGQQQWQIGLRPKGSALAAVFKEAIVAGADSVSRIHLFDAHGDHTEIILLDIAATKTGLSPEELKQFAE